jgi:hypothetical protein
MAHSVMAPFGRASHVLVNQWLERVAAVGRCYGCEETSTARTVRATLSSTPLMYL